MSTPERDLLLSQYTHQAPIALSVSGHNRVGGRRTDEAWTQEAWSAPTTRVLLLHDAQLVVDAGPDGTAPVWLAPAQAPTGARVLLGEYGGELRFAVLADALPGGMRTRPVRESLVTLEAEEAALVLQAVGLAEWHRSHLHCPRCAGVLDLAQAGHVKVCRACGRQQFPRTDPAVIMLVTDRDDRCLLGRSPRWPEGRFSTLAGFVEPGESLEQAVAREVEEEVGVVIDSVGYFGNQPWPFPASLMLGFFARAATTDIDVDGAEIVDARWFTRPEMRAQADAGTLVLPGGISISRSLVETWYGGPLPGRW